MVSAASAPLISEHVADAAALAHVHLREGQVETCVLPPRSWTGKAPGCDEPVGRLACLPVGHATLIRIEDETATQQRPPRPSKGGCRCVAPP